MTLVCVHNCVTFCSAHNQRLCKLRCAYANGFFVGVRGDYVCCRAMCSELILAAFLALALLRECAAHRATLAALDALVFTEDNLVQRERED